MMVIDDIFTSFIVSDMLDVDNEHLEKFCLSKISKDNTNSGSLDLLENDLQQLLTEVAGRVNAVCQHVGISNHWELEISRCWANLNCTEDIVPPHCHPESFFSCVYYVSGKGKDSGRLEFISPINQMLPIVRPNMIENYNKYLAATWWVDPEPGKLIIFPSWLWHFVHKNTSGSDRISIAFDTKIRKK